MCPWALQQSCVHLQEAQPNEMLSPWHARPPPWARHLLILPSLIGVLAWHLGITYAFPIYFSGHCALTTQASSLEGFDALSGVCICS